MLGMLQEGELTLKARIGFWIVRRLLDITELVQDWTYKELDRIRDERANASRKVDTETWRRWNV